MEIYRGDYVRIGKTTTTPSYIGRIGLVRDVYNIRIWGEKGIIESDQDIYTDLRKKPFKVGEIEACSSDKNKLLKKSKKEVD